MGGKGEEAFIFEEFEVEAGEEGVGAWEMGGLLVVGFVEEVEGAGGFACHLGGEDGVCEGACELEGGQAMAEAEVVVEDGAVAEGEELALGSAVEVFGIAKRGSEGEEAAVFARDAADDEADEPFGGKQGDDPMGLFVVLGPEDDPFNFFYFHRSSLTLAVF
jgi:hypothetical protein